MDMLYEIITVMTIIAMIVAGVIKKYDLIPQLLLLMNGKNGKDRKNEASFDSIGCIKRFDECSKKQKEIADKVTSIASIQQRNITRGVQNKEKLKLDAERFNKVEENITTINTNVAVIKERIAQQYKAQNDMMRIILDKIG